MKVVVLTTSYPSPEHPVAGTFVESSVEAVRAAGIDVEVVSPATFRHFGVALGAGIAQNLRGAPWKLALVPGFLASFCLAARRVACDADITRTGSRPGWPRAPQASHTSCRCGALTWSSLAGHLRSCVRSYEAHEWLSRPRRPSRRRRAPWARER
jgi:hypothetical protein